ASSLDRWRRLVARRAGSTICQRRQRAHLVAADMEMAMKRVAWHALSLQKLVVTQDTLLERTQAQLLGDLQALVEEHSCACLIFGPGVAYSLRFPGILTRARLGQGDSCPPSMPGPRPPPPHCQQQLGVVETGPSVFGPIAAPAAEGQGILE